eukprot:CAMPEP_0183721356 /NCGR_PEP_ID=MMETSP0737-20130205/13648_1 /TAXON_ID=385413 /ORGANISM="Thalassiosira miniscula, Strain CCMP1093" /LENGTH=500 /DNA_ID=CAMNT_0025951353 /DNA_START=113 /DNA_END=1615 /DNA_ORIENTATION=+
MIIGTALRQGRLIASKRPALLIGYNRPRLTVATRSLSAALHRYCVDPTLTTAQQQQNPVRPFSATSNLLATNSITKPLSDTSSPLYRYHPKPCVELGSTRSFHTSLPFPQATSEPRSSNALPPSLRSAIIEELRSVDVDNNGRIDAEELKALLRKRNDSFTEEEILELSELFYTSLGASSVDIHQFLEALNNAVVAQGSTIGGGGNMAYGEAIPLAEAGRYKTHPLGIGTCASEFMFNKTHGKYSEEDLNIKLTHVPPVTFSDKTALFAVKCVRVLFDTATLWNVGSVTKEKILNRAIFLETIAAIPGMVAAIIRHFRSLRNMARDGGMLNMFLEEANNERMHLLTFIRMKEPGYLFRAAVIGAQVGFGSFFLTAYVINPSWCHRFIGYIEEEACHTYTKILTEMDCAPSGSELADWRTDDAPKIAKAYWHLGEYGTVYDVIKAVRADEAEHRDVNHSVSGFPDDAVNPLYDPRVKLDDMLKKYVKGIMDKNAGDQSSVA